MKIISYNIACLPYVFNTMGAINLRINNIINLLLKLNPDIILLQEVFSIYARKTITKALEKNNYYVTLCPHANILLNGGLLIASKYKIINNNYYTYKNCFGEDLFAYKGILHCQIYYKNELINIFNTHLNNKNPKFKLYSSDIYTLQKKQVYEYIDFVNKYNNDKCILGGDFNIKYNSKLYRILITKLKKNHKIFRNKKNIITDNSENIQIDYIFYCYKNQNDFKKFNTYYIKNTSYSDHNILITQLS